MNNEPYDYIIAGGGLAGLSLACHLALSPLKDKKILLLDREAKTRNDRTWCFWTDQPHIFDHLAHRRWDHLWYFGYHWQKRIPLSPYRYQMLRGIDFYQEADRLLEQMPALERRYGEISTIEDLADGARVRVGDTDFYGNFVFDGRFNPREFSVDTNRYHFLKQHFVGWEVEVDKDVFDPEAATFFDFRVPQSGGMSFMYVLPFSSRRALVEYTLFSANLLKREQYEQPIEEYLRTKLKVDSWKVLDSEDGIIPMTDQPFNRRDGKHILRIGTNGGRVKASTGFAFFRTQQDSAAIVESLVRYGQPFQIPKPPARYRLFDSLLLQILYRDSDLSEPVFTRLFARNPIQRIFRFLDEQGSLGENLQLMWTTKWRYFLKAWWNLKIKRKV